MLSPKPVPGANRWRRWPPATKSTARWPDSGSINREVDDHGLAVTQGLNRRRHLIEAAGLSIKGDFRGRGERSGHAVNLPTGEWIVHAKNLS